MLENTARARTLVGAKPAEVRNWVSGYIQLTGLQASVDEVIAAALQVEGTHKGVTKTNVRKARRQLITTRRHQ